MQTQRTHMRTQARTHARTRSRTEKWMGELTDRQRGSREDEWSGIYAKEGIYTRRCFLTIEGKLARVENLARRGVLAKGRILVREVAYTTLILIC